MRRKTAASQRGIASAYGALGRNRGNGGGAPEGVKECCMTCVHAPEIMLKESAPNDPPIAECEVTGARQVARQCRCMNYSYDEQHESKKKVWAW